MEEETIKREEFFIDWLPRISEKLQFILLNIKENRDISDGDYDLLRVLHKTWFYGEFPLYKTQLDIKEESSVQQGLFSDNVADEEDGTKVEPPKGKTKKK